ncbi:MAG: acyloxyacyl hydrolase [Acidobacteriaceae bacterium]
MKKQIGRLILLLFCWGNVAVAQSSSSSNASQPIAGKSLASDPVRATMQSKPWDRGVFIDGGFGTAGEESDRFLNAGFRLGKVLTGAAGRGVARGQFELAVQAIPYWQSFTPKTTYTLFSGTPQARQVTTGGTYTGLSLTPVIFRWDLVHWKKVMPWLQGGGGLIWTNHKYPPNGARGTSVWNFEPQIGVGFHYFVKPRQSIAFGANAVHISNASLGDANPGVNATVQLQIGYTWWK